MCMERYEDAIKWMSKAIDMRPEWPLYLCNRGKAYIKLGKQKMVKQIIKALKDLNLAFKTRNSIFPLFFFKFPDKFLFR